MSKPLPLGKLPPHLLTEFLRHFSQSDPSLLLGPGIGLDCAILDLGDRLLALKSEPITFITEDIGWYAVQIACNDIVTTGALPHWMMVTLLLPEAKTTPDLAMSISKQLAAASQEYGITLIGGHTEITTNLDRPIINTTMIGEVTRTDLVTPRGALPGDILLLTQSIPIEGIAILSREFTNRLEGNFSRVEIQQAQNYLVQPGISVFKAARLAHSTGAVHAMHDPTEGGLAAALHEMAQAASCKMIVASKKIPIDPLALRICQHFNIDPLATISSGALLLAVPPEAVETICATLVRHNIPCTPIGQVEKGTPEVLQIINGQSHTLPLPARDEIARVFEEYAP